MGVGIVVLYLNLGGRDQIWSRKEWGRGGVYLDLARWLGEAGEPLSWSRGAGRCGRCGRGVRH